MFNSSLRRVARNCPHAQPAHLSPLRPSPTPNHASISASFTTRSHQRRNSSSKPPIPPNNGHPPIPAASVKQVGAPRSNSDKRPGTESRLSKRGNGKVAKAEKVEVKTKEKEDYSNEWTRSLPAVPSTQHLNPKDVYVASFFSTHRPISITGPLPPETAISDIDKIFAIRPQRPLSQRKAQDVIYTLSSAVQNLDAQVEGQQQQQGQEEGASQRADFIKALTQHNNANPAPQQSDNAHHLDGQPQANGQVRVGGNVKLVIQALARQFRPFNPPPAPVAAPEVEFFAPETVSKDSQAGEEAQAAALEQEIVQQDAQTILNTITQQHASVKDTDEKSNTFFTPSFVPTSSYRTRRGMLLVRHMQHTMIRDPSTITSRKAVRIPGTERVKMYMISVKRQRRLKMKKHKYKKLQRKTRNLRRRQGKI